MVALGFDVLDAVAGGDTVGKETGDREREREREREEKR